MLSDEKAQTSQIYRAFEEMIAAAYPTLKSRPPTKKRREMYRYFITGAQAMYHLQMSALESDAPDAYARLSGLRLELDAFPVLVKEGKA